MNLRITYRHMQSSAAVASILRKRAEELERLYPRIVSCHVVFEQAHKHSLKGRLFHVRIDLGVPRAKLTVSRDAQAAHEHENAFVAIRDAFDAARRQLEDFASRHNGPGLQNATTLALPSGPRSTTSVAF